MQPKRHSTAMGTALGMGLCAALTILAAAAAKAQGYGSPLYETPVSTAQSAEDNKAMEEPAKPAADAAAGEQGATEKVSLLTEEIPPVTGPKRTVAVGKFDAIGAFTSKYGNWDIGGGLAAMLTSALAESKRFIVLERANIQQILSEQELKASGVTNPDTGPKVHNLTGVQLLIYGAVTEFGSDDEGGGFSLGLAGGPVGNLLGGAVSQESTSGTVAMDIRVVDTTTGQVLETHQVRGQVDNSSWDVSVGYKGISLGTNEFVKTPLGQAARQAITQAVQHIARDAENRPWTGRVVEFDGAELYINAGANSGLKQGDKFKIERVAKTMTDPETGEILGVRRKELGLLELKGVEEKLAYGSFVALDPEPPQRGDVVVIAK
ncbi:MAG: CsgG/HfaB family protein [Alphaproteobacteria bacterium]